MNPFSRKFSILLALVGVAVAQAAQPSGSLVHRKFWESSPMSAALELGMVSLRYPNFPWIDSDPAPVSVQGFRLGLEWMPFGEADFGKLGFGVSGTYAWSGKAQYTDQSASLLILPLETYVSYRGDFVPQQILVPFVKAGPSATFVKHKWDKGGGAPYSTYLGLDMAAGLELCLSRVETKAARHLDQAFGINDTYIVLEYVRSRVLAERWRRIDLEHNEWRFGLRFEL